MAEWDRRSPWRQGHVLTAETVAALGLLSQADQPQPLMVVVSHDCDLAQDPTNEPVVEVIIGRRVDSADGNFTHGKNPRRLHLPSTDAGAAICIELMATERRSIPKRLAGHLPSATVLIDPARRNTLQYWLAARYRRSAFPMLSIATSWKRALPGALPRFSNLLETTSSRFFLMLTRGQSASTRTPPTHLRYRSIFFTAPIPIPPPLRPDRKS